MNTLYMARFLRRCALLGACLFVCSWGAAARQTPESAGRTGLRYDPARDPAADLRAAVGEASKSGKRILLDIGGEWCIWCRRLDTFFMKHEDAEEFLRANYILLKINVSKENQNEKFLSGYPPVAGYPHLFVLDSDGSLLRSQDTGALESGKYHDHDKVMAFLRRWCPKAGS